MAVCNAAQPSQESIITSHFQRERKVEERRCEKDESKLELPGEEKNIRTKAKVFWPVDPSTMVARIASCLGGPEFICRLVEPAINQQVVWQAFVYRPKGDLVVSSYAASEPCHSQSYISCKLPHTARKHPCLRRGKPHSKSTVEQTCILSF